MKIISLWQPWATLIAVGLKQYETRHWTTAYRGPLLIHAAKRKMTQDDLRLWNSLVEQCPQLPPVEDIPFGAVVASTTLKDCSRMVNYKPKNITGRIEIASVSTVERMVGNWAEGRYAWKLDDVKALSAPIPLRGHQGLWDADEDLVSQLTEVCNAN